MREDRRQHPRVRIPLEVEYQLRDQRLCQQATLVDLSAGGVAMLTEDPLPAGGLLAFVRFKLGAANDSSATDVQAATEVVRCIEREGVGRKTEYLVGAKFLNLDDENLEALRAFIRLQLEAAPDPDKPAPRVDCEQPIAIQYQRFDDFVDEVATNLSKTGMFIRVKKPAPLGTVLDFSFQLGDDFALLEGKAEVVWTRPLSDGPERPSGMGVKFLELDEVSERVLEQMIEKKLVKAEESGDPTAASADGGDLAELEAERDALQTELDKARERIATERGQLEKAAALIVELKNERDTVRADLERSGETLETGGDQPAELARLAEQRQDAERRVAEFEGEREALRARLEERDGLQEQSEARIGKIEQQRDALKAELEERNALREQSEARIAGIEQERDALKAELDQRTTHREQSDIRISEIERERDALRAELDEHSTQREWGEARLSEIEQERDALKAELEEASRQLEAERQEQAQIREQAESRLARFEKEQDSRQGEFDKQDEIREQSEARIAQLEGERNSARGELERVQQEYESRIAELESARDRARERETVARDEQQTLLEQFETTRTEHAERLSAAEAGSGRVAELEAALADADSKIEAHASELESVRAEALEHERRKFEEAESATADLERRVNEAEEQNRTLSEELERETEAHAEASRQSADLRASMTEIQDRSEQRVEALREQLAGAGDEATELRHQLEAASGKEQVLHDELDQLRSESSAAEERSESDLQASDARVRQLEEELEATRSAEGELRLEVEQTTSRREELNARVEQLSEEGDVLRSAQTESEQTLRNEIDSLQAQLPDVEGLQHELNETNEQVAIHRQAEEELRSQLSEAKSEVEIQLRQFQDADTESGKRQEKLDAAIGELEEVRGERERAYESIERLESELADARGQVEAQEGGLQEEIASLAERLRKTNERSEDLEGDLTEALARSERLAEENRELDSSLKITIGDQARLEKEFRATPKGRATSKPPAARPGALRAAALVGFGLILGFMSSYPFEVLLASADPIEIRPATALVATAAPREGEAIERAELVAPQPESELEAKPAATEDDGEPEPPAVAPSRPSPESAVERWAAAWSDQRVADYLGAYATTFVAPDDMERSLWELQRQRRIQKPRSISVTLGTIEMVGYSPQAATVSFNQSYVADAYSDRVRKTLELIWEGDAWRIASETSEPLG